MLRPKAKPTRRRAATCLVCCSDLVNDTLSLVVSESCR